MGRQSYTVDAARAGQARAALGLTQGDAADRLGVGRVTLNRIENGHANVSLELLERMADHYAVTREWLLNLPDRVDAHRHRIVQALEKVGDGLADVAEIVAVLNAEAAAAAAVNREKVVA